MVSSGTRRPLASYRSTLKVISTRTGTALPSLITSFAILHELTAIVPFAGIYLSAKALGLGERVITFVQDESVASETGWLRQACRNWVHEGETWAARIGNRYGIWGFEQGRKRDQNEGDLFAGRIAGDVANAVMAYGLTKALFPFRIGLSLYLAPALSRRILDPLGRTVMYRFRRKPPSK